MLYVAGTAIVCSAAPPADSPDFFEQRIRPVLVEHCYECHTSDGEQAGGLTLDTKSGRQLGGDSGPLIRAGAAEDSRLFRVISLIDDELEMPPDGPLPREVIDDFRRWIEAGAVDPSDDSPAVRSPQATIDWQAAREHWAYREVRDVPVPPAVTDSRLGDADPIDRFVAQKLAEKSLQAAPQADAAALIRRVCFDLTGLPPTPEAVREFVSAADPEAAYEALVDRCLASPRFGERFARHWLDVTRYGESVTLRGLIFNEAWRFRNYVIDAFNEDRPWNEVLVEHLAGDLLELDSPEAAARAQVAVTFLCLGNTNLEKQQKYELEMDFIDEQLDTIGRAFLGQTLGCARCHDHKFDPIPTADYYALAGILHGSVGIDHGNVSNWFENPLPLPPDQQEHFEQIEAELDEAKREAARLKSQAADEEDEQRKKELAGQQREVDARVKQLQEVAAARPKSMGLRPRKERGDLAIHVRGSIHNKGDVVPRGVLRVIADDEAALAIPPDACGRLELARWIADDSNPLTPRVLVNRVWLWVMGEGLVRTPDNFGVTGRPPTHPELLDRLTADFIRDGWSIKRLVKRIVMSSTYRRSSALPAASDPRRQIDPDNRLWWRADRKPVSAESIRDAVLFISGELDLSPAEKTIRPGTRADYHYVHDSRRRSIYMPAFRNAVPELLEPFNYTDVSFVTGRRTRGVIAQQALLIFNHPEFAEAARLAAVRNLSREADEDTDERIRYAFLQCLSREPTTTELENAVAFFSQALRLHADADGSTSDTESEELTAAALAEIYHSLFAAAEFRQLD